MYEILGLYELSYVLLGVALTLGGLLLLTGNRRDEAIREHMLAALEKGKAEMHATLREDARRASETAAAA